MLVIPFSFLLFSLHIYYHVLSSCHGRIACVRKPAQERVWISVAFPRVRGSACGSQRSEDSRMDNAASDERSGRRKEEGNDRKGSIVHSILEAMIMRGRT